MTGPQAAYVFAFLNGSLQLAPLVQLLGGYMRGERVADRVMRLQPTAQVGAGGQFAYVIPGTNEHLQIGGQAAASFTDPIGGTSTVDYGYQLFLQWKF
jgi:hypothetical protein